MKDDARIIADLEDRIRRLENRVPPPAAAGASSTWLSATGGSPSFAGGWTTGLAGGTTAAAVWSGYSSSPDITQLDPSTFEVPAGIYFCEWMVYKWSFDWTAPSPYTGDGWLGYRSGPIAATSSVVYEWIFDEIRRTRANYLSDSLRIPGSFDPGLAIEMFRGHFHADIASHLTLSLYDLPELYGSTALDISALFNHPFAADPLTWFGYHTLYVVRIGG